MPLSHYRKWKLWEEAMFVEAKVHLPAVYAISSRTSISLMRIFNWWKKRNEGVWQKRVEDETLAPKDIFINATDAVCDDFFVFLTQDFSQLSSFRSE